MTQFIAPLVCLLLFMTWATSAHAEDSWQTTKSGLKYQTLEAGKGRHPAEGDIVVVDYTGTFKDGRQFDSSRGKTPFRFTLGKGEVIDGWDEGVALMQVGSRFKFHVPWKLAYGEAGRAPIPPKTDLMFDVELLEIIEPLGFERPEGEDVKTLDGGTRVKVLKRGQGQRPSGEQGVSLRVALYNSGGKLVFSTDQAGQVLGGELKSLTIAGTEMAFLRPLVSTLCVGERVTAAVPSDQAFGQQSPDPRLIPPGTETFWILELKSINDVPKFVMPEDAELETTASGLKYQIVKAGTGPRPTRSDDVSVYYTGWLTDGTLFDSGHARGEPTEFPLGKVIPGWIEGLQLMKEGAIYRFVIPAKLAYGARQVGTLIKPNSTLVFLVELLDIKK